MDYNLINNRMRVQELILEKFINAFSLDEKSKYQHAVWNMLQKSYESIGGIRGKGFSNMNDMIRSNLMFKIGKVAGKPVSVIVYKNKGGARKMVAMGTDGSADGLRLGRNSLKAELTSGRAFGEFSGPVFGALKKLIPSEILITLLIPAVKVPDIIGKRVIPGKGDDLISTANPDPYEPFYYQREIGGHMHTKIAYGDPKGQARWYNTKDNILDLKQ